MPRIPLADGRFVEVEQTVFLDTCVFVCSIMPGHPEQSEAQQFLARLVVSAHQGQMRLLCSSLVMFEFCHTAAKYRYEQVNGRGSWSQLGTGDKNQYFGSIAEAIEGYTRAVSALPITWTHAWSNRVGIESAIATVRDHGVGFADACHYAAMDSDGARQILTNDADFKRIPGVLWVSYVSERNQ